MEPKVLADSLVEAGIGRKAVHGGMPHYSTDTVSPLDSVVWVRADEFITDWRVAGKVLELCGSSHLYWDDVDFGCDLTVGIGKKEGFGTVDGYARLGLPRAIIEAWYEATEQEGE